jgi:hypothetical protein
MFRIGCKPSDVNYFNWAPLDMSDGLFAVFKRRIINFIIL